MSEARLEEIIAEYPTPFHIYDAKGIVDNIRRFIKAFSWAKDFKEYFAVKATPNPYIMRLLQKEGVGADCSSLAELILCEKVGITGDDIIFHPTIHLMKNMPKPWKWALLSILMTLPM